MWKHKKKWEKIYFLPTDRIFPNPYQARLTFPEDSLSELAKSIARFGMIHPITVREKGGEYELVVGERRWRAAKLLEMDRVPCRIADVSGRISAETVLAENTSRESLDFFQEAEAIDRLNKSFRTSPSEISRRFGLSESAVANKLRLLRFSREERQLILDHGLTFRHAQGLLKIREPALRLFALKHVIAKNLSATQSESFLAALADFPENSGSVFPQTGVRQRPLRRGGVKDLGFFLNSVDRAISGMQEAGVLVTAEKSEFDDCITYSIRIPKGIKH